MKWMVPVVLCLGACGGDDGVGHLADAPPPPDAAPDAPVCAPLTGAGTMHTGGNVTTAQTWTAAQSPHLIPGDISITAALTIEACAVVRIGGDHAIIVRQTGSLTAAGMPGLPVTFERLDPTNSWNTLSVTSGGRMS